MTEFSKEHNKQSTSTVHHKHYCYRTCFNRFRVRPLSKIAVIIIIRGGVINFKSNFSFHNIFIYSRATFNNTVACCVDFTRETSRKEFRKISVLKIPTNRKT